MAATSVSAAVIQWNVSGTFVSGATANRTAVWNSATSSFESGWILVSGDSDFSAATYSNTVPNRSQFLSGASVIFFNSTAGAGGLGLFLFSGDLPARLGNPSSAIQLDVMDEYRSSCGTRRRGDASFNSGQDVTPTPVPEPGTLALLGLGLAALGVSRRRKAA